MCQLCVHPPVSDTPAAFPAAAQAPAGSAKTCSPTVVCQMWAAMTPQLQEDISGSNDHSMNEQAVRLLQQPAAELMQLCSSAGLLPPPLDTAVMLKLGRWQEVQQLLPLARSQGNMATFCKVVENTMVDASIAAGEHATGRLHSSCSGSGAAQCAAWCTILLATGCWVLAVLASVSSLAA
jgi:hypothetical protein